MPANRFERVLSLASTTKDLVSRSYGVSLLALDAMVRAKRAGDTLRGFDVASQQMRAWATELHRCVEELNEAARAVVESTSRACRQHRMLTLVEATSAAAARPLSARVAETARHVDAAVSAQWSVVEEKLAVLNQLGMMAVVLSRTAMIEAAGAPAEHREHVGEPAREFRRTSEVVVERLKALLRQVRREVP